MMKKKTFFWVGIPLVALLGIGVAGAGYKHHRGHHNPERMVERISDRLELSGEQRQKLDAVKDAFLQGRNGLKRERQEVMNRLIDEVRNPEIDSTRIQAMIDQRKVKLDAMASQVMAPVIEFHKSLDDAQRDKIINLMESMRDWGHFPG